MRTLVTGATGFIGGQIARAAVARGWEVRGLRRRRGAVGAIGDIDIDWRDGDLSDGDALRRAMEGCQVVFHAAAYYPWTLRRIPKATRIATAQIRGAVDAARDCGVERLVYTSTLTTVGPPSEPGRLADERDFYLPGSLDSSYHECKWAMEAECYRAAAAGLPVVVLIPTAVFGPGDVKPTTGRLLADVARGRLPVSVEVPINVVDVRDVAEAHLVAAEKGRSGERAIVGGHNVSLPELFDLTAALAGRRRPLRLSLGLVRRVIRAADLLRLPLVSTVRTLHTYQHLDSSKARREFGLAPRPLEDTVRDTLDWFRQHDYL